MNANGTKARREVCVEPMLVPSLSAMSKGEREKCLKAIEWFESEGAPRNKSSQVGYGKRRIRSVHVSKALCLVYAESNAGCNWAWAGRAIDLGLVVGRLEEPPETVEHLVLAEQAFDADCCAEPQDSSGSLKGLLDAVSRIESAVADAAGKQAEAEAEAEAAMLLADDLLSEADADPDAEADASGDVDAGKFRTLLDNYNAVCAENERLAKDLRATTRRMEIAHAEMASRSQEVAKAKEARMRADAIAKELAAIKFSDRRAALAAIKDGMIEEVKIKCAKVLDDRANLLLATERGELIREAQELGQLAVKIRNLRIEPKA